MEKEFTVTKGTIECYKLRHSKGPYWADITLDVNANGNGGRIQIASDFGDWQYYWGASGPFKQFLISLEKYYVARKFKADQWVDNDDTIKAYKESVIEFRRDGTYTKQKARDIFDEIKNLEQDAPSDPHGFEMAIMQQEFLMQHYAYIPPIRHDLTPGFKSFWEMIWPVFIGELKKEMAVAV